MNRGRGRNMYMTPRGLSSSRPGAKSSNRHTPDGSSNSGRQTSEWKARGSISKSSEHDPMSGYANHQDFPSLGGKDIHPHRGNLQQGQNSPESVGSSSRQPECSFSSDSSHEKDCYSLSAKSGSKDGHLDVKRNQTGRNPGEGAEDSKMLHHEFSHKVNIANVCPQDESQLPLKSAINDRLSQNNVPDAKASPMNPAAIRISEQSDHSAKVDPFDICLTKTGTTVMLKPSLFAKNREKRNEINRSNEGQKGNVLQSGMVHLKSYLSYTDQVKIVKICRDCGLGHGGFYQPGYRDGAKLHLKMMCLGKNWDPETSEYGECRPIDGARPPIIPTEFYQLVKKAIQDSHALVGQDVKGSKVEGILPWMSPNICIVNFYTASGRLGLHQDRDESNESLHKGLPVVSFSIGDSAEFLYGDERDVDKAKKVVLESGDVLIFGGKSRHIFHGVTAILPNTAPKSLLEETNLCPGRLNLTFREY